MTQIIAGQLYGRLEPIEYLGCVNGKMPYWRCKCLCGKIADVGAKHLTSGNIKSCGCLKLELRQKDVITCKICGLETCSSNRYIKDGVTRSKLCKKCQSGIQTEARKKRNKKDKLNAFKAYCSDDVKCSCCCDKHLEFLTIDHINGGGNQHRKSLPKSSGAIYRWLRDNNYPDGFRVLCINCNYSIGLFGYCPHKDNNGQKI